MFRVDRTENRIAPLTRRSFGALQLREREHLQEWLVHQPDALGEELRLKFWAKTLAQLKNDGVSTFANISPSKDSWINAGSGLGGCPYSLFFVQNGVKVQVSMQSANTEQNKWIYDHLLQHREAIEAQFGGPLDWRRLEHRKLSLVCCEQSFDGFNPEEWPRMIGWLSETFKRFEQAFRQPLANLSRSPRAQNEDA